MNFAQIHIDPAIQATLPMRSILGMNNSPSTHLKYSAFPTLFKWFKDLNLRHIRHHDATLSDQGQLLFDIHRVFPLFHADENDPENYVFGQSDDAMATLADLNLEVDFRLGEAIDKSGNWRLIQPPEDPEKWARICRNIVAHYKNGEMDGMHMNVTRVTVWEESDNRDLFAGTVEQYAELFIAVWKLFRKEFPDLKIGGPTFMGKNYGYFERFLQICKENDVTPDFATVTQYLNSVEETCRRLAEIRALLDKYGFTECRIVFSEWHYTPDRWHDGCERSILWSPEAAVFSSSSLIRMMDEERLDVVFYYSWQNSAFAPTEMGFRAFGMERHPIYFGLKFFNDIASLCPERLAVSCEGDNPTDVLAGKTEDGKVRLLISRYIADPVAISCRVDGAVSCRMRVVREDFSETDADEGVDLPAAEDGSFILAQEFAGSRAWLLEFTLA